MRAILLLVILFPCAAFAAPDDSAGTIGAEWNNSTSVEFPATSTDAEGNVIYNYYNDQQFFSPPSEPAAPILDKEKNPSHIILDATSQGSGNDEAKGLFNDFANAGGVYGSDDSDFDFYGTVVNVGTIWNVILSGSIIREEAEKKGIKRVTLKGFNEKKRMGDISDWLPLTKGDLSIVAAAAIIHDANIEQVKLSLTSFDIRYLAKGYLLYLIPWKYHVLVQVNSLENTVLVTYPWYEFFLWKPVTKIELKTSIDSTVSDLVQLMPEATLDRQARIFASVADLLKDLHGN
jgi:hypothetical protein